MMMSQARGSVQESMMWPLSSISSLGMCFSVFLFFASHGADRLKGAGSTFGRALICQQGRLLLAAAFHLREQFDDFLAQSRRIFDSKFAVSVAQNTMGGRLLKVVFQDQAVGSNLHAVVAKGCGGIMYVELEFDRNRVAIRGLDDIIRLSYQGICVG